MYSDQSMYQVRFEWGERGIDALGLDSDLIILVDVLSFSTCVDVATARGAIVLPFPWNDERAEGFARQQQALLATKERCASSAYSLSPQSLGGIAAGTRLVLPSPNGATLSLRAAEFAPTCTGCLRNAAAVARYAKRHGEVITVIACGERWPDGSLRVAWEDLIGAGAIIAQLTGRLSPEAEAAVDTFRQNQALFSQRLRDCSSGRELVERGFGADLEWATAVNVSQCVPILQDGCYLGHWDHAAKD